MVRNRSPACPLCQSRGKTNNLLLRQINLSTAVYLCEDKACEYPTGYEWIEVQRSLDSLSLEIRQSTGLELDRWLEEVFESEVVDATPPPNACKSTSESDDFLSEIFKEIESANYDVPIAFDFNGFLINANDVVNPSCQISAGDANHDEPIVEHTIGDLTEKSKALLSFEGKDSCNGNETSKVENTAIADVATKPNGKFQGFRFTSLVVQPATSKIKVYSRKKKCATNTNVCGVKHKNL